MRAESLPRRVAGLLPGLDAAPAFMPLRATRYSLPYLPHILIALPTGLFVKLVPPEPCQVC